MFSGSQEEEKSQLLHIYISHSGYKVPRMQLRECVRRVDPEGVEERSRKQIKRAVYHSDGLLQFLYLYMCVFIKKFQFV